VHVPQVGVEEFGDQGWDWMGGWWDWMSVCRDRVCGSGLGFKTKGREQGAFRVEGCLQQVFLRCCCVLVRAAAVQKCHSLCAASDRVAYMCPLLCVAGIYTVTLVNVVGAGVQLIVRGHLLLQYCSSLVHHHW
jgi:hypothetical protein